MTPETRLSTMTYSLQPSPGQPTPDKRKPGEETFYASNLLPLPRISRRRRRMAPGYIPRPANSFILFRKDAVQRFKDAEADKNDSGKGRRQAEMSKEISRQWKTLSREERAEWDRKAAQIKTDHQTEFPNYSYRPNRRPRAMTFSQPSIADEIPSYHLATTMSDAEIAVPSLPPSLPPFLTERDAFHSPLVSYNKQWVLPPAEDPSPRLQGSYDEDDLRVSYSNNLYDDRWYMGEQDESPAFTDSPLPPTPITSVASSFESPIPLVNSRPWQQTYTHQYPGANPLQASVSEEAQQPYLPRPPAPCYTRQIERPLPEFPNYNSSHGDVQSLTSAGFDGHVAGSEGLTSSSYISQHPQCIDCRVPAYHGQMDDRPESSSGSEWSTDSGISNEEWLSMVDGLSLDFNSPIHNSPAAPQAALHHSDSDSTLSNLPTHW